MPKYLCDRCNGPRLTRPRVGFVIKNKLIDSVGWIKLCSPTGYVMTLDLCENCMRDLSEFMSDGGNEDGRS